MKRLVALLLVLVLTSSLVFATASKELLTANASEQETVEAVIEPVDDLSSVEPAQEELAPPTEILEPVEEEVTEPTPTETTGQQAEAEESYWVADPTYQTLLSEYESLCSSGAITNAIMRISGSAAGTITAGNRQVVSNGCNAPLYDDALGIHLTTREGLPQAGTASDRSTLRLIESREDGDVYEALFFFNSSAYPSAPFVALKTYVILSTDDVHEEVPAQVAGTESNDDPDSAEGLEVLEDGKEPEEAKEHAGSTLNVDADNKNPYSYYVERFWSAYFSGDHQSYLTAANFTVSEILEDGTVRGTVGSQSLTIQGVSGEARVLTDASPTVGQTSTAALLTKTGSSYDALFLFGDASLGSVSGSAVGGLQVSLDVGPDLVAETDIYDYPLRESPTMSLLSNRVATLSLDPNSLYVGQGISGSFSGNYWYWNGLYYGGLFGMTFAWQGTLTNVYMSCVEPMVWGPESVNFNGAPVYGTITGIDRANGLVYVSLWSTGAANYLQNLSATAAIPVSFTGDIHLVKQSSNPGITNNHPLYDLSGTQYGLYGSWLDANTDANRIHTFTVKSNAGDSNPATGLQQSTYYLKELKAGKGYRLDPVIYTVQLNSASTTFTAMDLPHGDPILAIVQKVDLETGQPYGKDDPNGLLLADGEFTVRYWNDYYDTIEEAEAAGAPTRTWVVKTEISGRAALIDRLLVAGSDHLYKDQHGDTIVPLGTIAIQETCPPPGYLLPNPNIVNMQQVKETGDPLNPVTRLNTVIIQEEPRELIVEKLETGTDNPIPNTEFTLYKESSAGAGDWVVIASHITDDYGKCVFSPVTPGSYKLDETRAHPEYAELEESGDGAHYFVITENSTGEVQVFYNDLIQVSVDVYKKTISLTNTALDGSKEQADSHVGQEEYLYRFGARSNSNVRSDEFVITDSLEFVTSKGYRMTTLWTGTAPAGMDYDGLMHVLYKTNMTDPSEPVEFSYNPMSANPYNANNPENNMSVSIEPGWRIWQECLSTTTATRLDVDALELEEGEYLVGIRIVYGGVVKGFYTGTGWDNAEDPYSYEGDRDAIQTLGAFIPFELRDWAYSVVATDALLPFDEMGSETVMEGSIRADLSRNWGLDAPVLTDRALDKVETRVIKPFSYERVSLGITPGSVSGRYLGLPTTGDTPWLALAGVIIVASVGIGLIVFSRLSKRKHLSKRGEQQ